MPTPEHQNFVPVSAGAQLRAYRENAQLTVDDVAHQLKLARRQVLAIENDEFDALPGPTFVRGFIRNYARLLRVDAAPLLEAGNLAPPVSAPMDRIAPTIGELPADSESQSSWTRWLIPTGLVLVLIAGIAFYEFGGMPTGMRKARKDASETVVAMPSTNAAADPTQSVEDAQAGGQTTPAAEPSVPPVARASNFPPASKAAMPAPSAALPAASPPASAAAVTANGATLPASPLPAGTGRVDLAFSGPSWIEVRDARGDYLISRTFAGDTPQTVAGALPLSLKIGNANAVRLQFNGTQIDLAPFTQREIARLTLPLPRQ